MAEDAKPFALVVRFAVRPGAEVQFDELTARTVEQIRTQEPGTLVYACHTVEDAPQERIFYELYKDRAAFEVHEKQDHVRHFLAAREELLEAVVVDFMTLTAGKTRHHD
ncbi:putative quinol monooxygenase [Nonomuraea lactucae]|uniref:putative quinol monooxygenase n=1 Tax=Nonomuraea lactucae TaxID=2249762 RepID=UPI000DE3E897|nr:antibiotic biosynthesis monooxygenase [Nonomuraea lactucae]